MTLILNNDEIARLLPMDAAIEALERGYRDLAAGDGANVSRIEIAAPTPEEGAVYVLKVMNGVHPGTALGTIRLNSDIIGWAEVAGSTRRVKKPAAPGERYVGLVLLFSTETGEPLAIVPDGVLQRLRVGATNAIAARYLAREDARTVAIIGAGWQAGAQAMAIRAVRPVTRIQVYSPRPESRTAFAAETAERLGISVVPCESVAAACDGADIVLCATSAIDPVLGPEAIRPGVHYSTIKPAEMPAPTVAACDYAVVHLRDNSPVVVRTRGVELAEETKGTLAPDAEIDEAAMPELTDLLTGAAPGRTDAAQSTCFLNYSGTGFQFTLVAGALYARARAEGAGRDLPTEWFTQKEHP